MKIGRVLSALLAILFFAVLGGILYAGSPFLAPLLALVFFIGPLTDGHRPWGRRLRLAAAGLVTAPLFLVAVLAPVHAVVLLVIDAGGRPGIHPLSGSWPNLAVAAAGLFLGFLGARMVFALFSELRKLDRLTVTRVSEAVLGLQEFRGVARVVPRSVPLERSRGPHVADLPPPPPAAVLEHVRETRITRRPRKTARVSERWTVRRFHLEDPSGKILIDPEGSRPWSGSGSPFWERYCKVLLTRHVERTDLDSGGVRETRTLLGDDPVHLLGWVVRNPDAPADAAGADRFLVRPSDRARDEAWAFSIPEIDVLKPVSWTGDLTHTLWGSAARWIRGEEPRDVFIVSDAEEVRIRSQYIRAIRTATLVVLVWILFPLWLVKDTVVHAPYRDWKPEQVAAHAPEEDRRPVLARASRSESPQARAEAVAAIAKEMSGDPEALRRVVESLGDPDSRVRLMALRQLPNLPLRSAPSDVKERLLTEFKYGKPDVVSGLLPVLPNAGLPPRTLVPALASVFERSRGQTALRLAIAESLTAQASAARASGPRHVQTIIPVVLEAMSSPRASSTLQFRARNLLHQLARSDPGTVGSELTRALVSGDEDTRTAAALALSSLGPAGRDALPALLEAADRHSSPQVRLLALRSLRSADPNDAAWLPLALRGLSDESPEVRREALDLLTASPPRRIDAAAAAALGSIAAGTVPFERHLAQSILRNGGADAARDAAPALVAGLRKTRDPIAWEGVRPSLYLAGDAALAPLLEAAHDAHPLTRRLAAETLGYLGPAAAPALQDLARDPDAQVRWAAGVALARVAPPAPAPAPVSAPRTPPPTARPPSISPPVRVTVITLPVRTISRGWMPKAPSTREPQVIPIVRSTELTVAARALGLSDSHARSLELLLRDNVLILVTGGVKENRGSRIHVTSMRRRPDESGLSLGIYEEEPDWIPSTATSYPYVVILIPVKDALPVLECVGRRGEPWPAKIQATFRPP